MNRFLLIFAFTLLTSLLAGCGIKTESFQGQIEEIKTNGFIVNCSDEVNKGKKGDAINTMGYGCFVEYTNETVFRSESGNSLTAKDFEKGSTVKIVLSEPANIRNYMEKGQPSVIYAKEIKLLIHAVEENLTIPSLPVNQIKQISVVESVGGKTVGVLVNKNQFQTFSDAIVGSIQATGEIPAIGENYTFFVEYESSKQQLSYWNGPHLRMISDEDSYYFLSDEAVKKIDMLISEAVSVDQNSNNDVFSININEMVVSLKDLENEINLEQLLGKPISENIEKLNGDGFTGSSVKKLSYDGLQMELFAPPPMNNEGPKFWIMTMELTNDKYRTSKGIGVGSKVEELKKAYPDIEIALDGRTDPNNCAYEIQNEMGYNYLRFEVNEGVVNQVKIYHLIP